MQRVFSLRSLIFAGLTTGCYLSGPAYAQLSNSTSQGDVGITVTVGEVIQISALTDISFTFDASLASPATGTDTFCVYSNASSAKYKVTAESSTGGSANFLLSESDGSSTLAYNVTYEDEHNNSESLISGMQNNTKFTANTTSTSCDTGDEATITVSIDKDDAVSAPAGEYTDTLTLLVEPE